MGTSLQDIAVLGNEVKGLSEIGETNLEEVDELEPHSRF